MKVLPENLRRQEQLSLTVRLANFPGANFSVGQREAIEKYFQSHVLMKISRPGAEEGMPPAVELKSQKSPIELGKTLETLAAATDENPAGKALESSDFAFKAAPFVTDMEKVKNAIKLIILPHLRL